jgi:hypothetical protein
MGDDEEMLPGRPTKAQRTAKARLVKELGEADFPLPGSLVVESQRCGKSSSACHHAPPSSTVLTHAGLARLTTRR